MRPYATVFLLFALQASIVWPHISFADQATCSPIFGAETAAIVTAATNVGLNSAEVCRAYAFLLARNGSGTVGVTPGCYRTQNDRIIKMNPGFVVGLAKALEELERLYGGRNIVQSGYRCSTDSQHPRGCAADIIYGSCYQRHGGITQTAWRCSSDGYDPSTNTWSQPEQKWIDANGRSAPYNIHLRLRYAPEGHHVEPVDARGCVTGRLVTSAPLGLGDQARNFLGGQPPPFMQPPPMMQPPLPPQPLTSSQAITSAFTPSTSLIPQASSTQTSTVTQINTSSTSNTNIGTGVGEGVDTSRSVSERLQELAYGSATATSSQAATSVPVVITGAQAGTIAYTSGQQPQGTTSVGGILPASEQTFTSAPTGQGTNRVLSPTETALMRTLATLKTALITLLEYLKPFGGRVHMEYDY